MYDASSNANYEFWSTRHTTLDVSLNFDDRKLQGRVVLLLESVSAADTIVLDSSHLDISSIKVDGAEAEYSVRVRKEPLGSPIQIKLAAKSVPGNRYTVEVAYTTTGGCTALQWLTPAQTAGSKPYMFSQCQAIHARSMYPCQDTPLIKSPFTFKLRSPYPVVATGNFVGATDFAHGSLVYMFEQPVPIPSYLAAMASGNLAIAQIGPRSVLYTEPNYLQASQAEMEPVIEKFIQIAESFLPAYAWSTYNVLVLPQSFP